MSLPSSIQRVLDDQQVQYNISDDTIEGQDSSSAIVQSLILKDAQGKVQLLFPAGRLIDLEALFRSFGRNFVGLAESEIQPLLSSHGLQALPAFPCWEDLPTFVEISLLQAERLWLETGTSQPFLVMNQRDFGNICNDAHVGKFTVDNTAITADTSDDEGQIRNSVNRFTQLRIKQRLDETLELPPLPETAQKIIRMRADPNADICDLTNIVEIDPSLATQVVSWAASPYYSAPGKIKSVHDAIVRVLGFDMVLNLALGLALGKTISSSIITPAQLKDYWRTSVYTAATVEALITTIDRAHRPSFGMAYLSGLLHNFGFLILAEVFPPYFSAVTRMQLANSHAPSDASEMHVLGISGNQIAAWLLQNWNMPEEVITALRQQNNLAYDGDHAVYPQVIFIAKQLLAKKGFGEKPALPIPENYFKELHLDIEAANKAVETILDASGDLDAIASQLQG